MLSQNLTEKQNKPVLLWTNPNPTSTFSAQTINIDLSAHDAVDIVFSITGNTDDYGTQTVYKGIASMLNGVCETGSSFFGASRKVSVSDSGVTFQSGYRYNTNNTPYHTEANGYTIPYQIYGL